MNRAQIPKRCLVCFLASKALAVLWLYFGLSPFASARLIESPKTCEFKEAGLLFQSQLLRSDGVLTGYELTMKNTGSKDLLGFEHPMLAHEVAQAFIYEVPLDRSRRTLVSAELTIYPMHGPFEVRQRRFQGRLGPGESKTFVVKIQDALKPGYQMRFDYVYDMRISADFVVRPPEMSFDDAANFHGAIGSKIAFGGCLSYTGVKLNEPSGK